MNRDNAKVTRIEINHQKAERQVRIRLLFRENEPQPYEFSLPYDGAMGLMRALQVLQVKHKIPIPPNLRPQGRPKLYVVETDPTA